MDRRTKRTHRLLGTALIDLLQERDLNNITIRDITERADVAYSTFFRNFESIDALLLTHMRAFVDELRASVTVEADAPYHVQARASITGLFTLLARDPKLPRVFFQMPAAQPVLKAFQQEQARENLAQLHAMNVSVPPAGPPLDLIVNNVIVQLFGMIAWWLDNGLQPAPATMAAHYEQLVLRPMWAQLIGPDAAANLFA